MVTSDHLSRLIGNIYDAALDPGLWPTFIHSAQQAFQAHSATLMYVDHNRLESSFVQFYGSTQSLMEDSHYRVEDDYWVQRSQRMLTGDVIIGTDLIGLKEMRETRLYNEIGKNLDVEYIIAAMVEKTPGKEAITAFIRDKGAGNYSGHDKHAFSLLIPHLQKANFIHQQLSTKRSIEHALQESSYGILVLDHTGRTIFHNQRAEDIFLDKDGVALRHEKLKLHDYDDQVQFSLLLNNSLATAQRVGSSAGGILRVRRPSGKLPYQVVISPVNAYSDQISLMNTGACVIFIHDPATLPMLSPELLKTSYGLTDAEADICVSLFSGRTMEETAYERKITRDTVKAHLKHVFTKCGVKSQASLLRLLALGLKT